MATQKNRQLPCNSFIRSALLSVLYCKFIIFLYKDTGAGSTYIYTDANQCVSHGNREMPLELLFNPRCMVVILFVSMCMCVCILLKIFCSQNFGDHHTLLHF